MHDANPLEAAGDSWTQCTVSFTQHHGKIDAEIFDGDFYRKRKEEEKKLKMKD